MPGDRVLDHFAGSGSTGIAAEMLNRHVVLIDNKAEYFKATIDRLIKNKVEDRIRIFQRDNINYQVLSTAATLDLQLMDRLLAEDNATNIEDGVQTVVYSAK